MQDSVDLKERIYKNERLSDGEKAALTSLLSNAALLDERAMDHPRQTILFISAFSGDNILEECLPQVDIWIGNGEKVSMRRVRDWLIEKYDLL